MSRLPVNTYFFSKQKLFWKKNFGKMYSGKKVDLLEKGYFFPAKQTLGSGKKVLLFFLLIHLRVGEHFLFWEKNSVLSSDEIGHNA